MSPVNDPNTGIPIYHTARSFEQRKREEPNARTGDTEWSICNQYGITYLRFRLWNNLPSREQQESLIIQVGRRYIVGYKAAPTAPVFTPRPGGQGGMSGGGSSSAGGHTSPAGGGSTAGLRKMPAEWTMSQPLIDYMKSWERPPLKDGRITGHAYRDTKGGLTIGFGRFIPPHEEHKWAAYNPEQGGTRELSMDEMMAMYREDVDRLAAADLRRMILVRLRQHEFDALIDFVFHRGAGALRDSGLQAHINSRPNGDFDANIIRDSFMKYAAWFDRNTGQWVPNAGFEKRRKEEIDMFLNARYTLHR
jgi:GH24 family phage-related lysozyme (muramidase)